jgi:hypothetical protein
VRITPNLLAFIVEWNKAKDEELMVRVCPKKKGAKHELEPVFP